MANEKGIEMIKRYLTYLLLSLASVLIVIGIFQFPSLTPRGEDTLLTAQESKLLKVMEKERDHCLSLPNAESINCRCYSKISGLVSVHETPKAAGAFYADQQDLARGQASNSC